MKKEIHLNIKGENVSLQAHDKNSIAYMEWLTSLENFKDIIAEAISEIRKSKGIKNE